MLEASIAAAQTKMLCITVDDLPVVNYGVADTAYQRDIITKLTRGFAQARVPAVGFVNEKKLYDSTGLSPFRVSLLEQWLDSGMDLGNHTFSHPDINKISCAEYFADVVRGETITRKLLAQRGRPLCYFRHPFLFLGSTKEKADSLSTFLAAHDYIVAPVTVDNDDYMFAVMYHRAIVAHDPVQASRIGNDYVAYMETKLRYYEQESVKLFGRPIAQVLLMHASRLNADYIDELGEIFGKLGYTFADLQTVLADDAYRTPITVYKKWGISWLDRWAMSAGKSGDFFKDEPDVPAYIKAGWQ
jgi:peptidoglycan/xylan/chitin deacetylase (PgdA/CDA1 family)